MNVVDWNWMAIGTNDDIAAKIQSDLIAAKRAFGTRDLITIEEVAAILDRSVRTARRRQAARLLPPRIRISRTFKYDRADVMEMRESTERRARAAFEIASSSVRLP